MSLRDHRDRAVGRKPFSRRMPKVTDFKMGTRIESEDSVDCPEPEACIKCGHWFSSDDLDRGVCPDCIGAIVAESGNASVEETTEVEIPLEETPNADVSDDSGFFDRFHNFGGDNTDE